MALKVFDLACEQGHVFEGWFKSHEDYDTQLERGLLRCPMCDSAKVAKQLSAPRLNLKHGVGQAAAGLTESPISKQTGPNDVAALQAQWVQQVKQWIKSTDNVGENFATEARKMHEGQIPERAIRGSATPEEYESLQEDGIDILPIPTFLDEEKLN